MMSKHTQWTLAERKGRIYAADRENLTIANIARSSDGDYSPSNARRLVACWNACIGISTENLEDNIPILALLMDELAKARAAIAAAKIGEAAKKGTPQPQTQHNKTPQNVLITTDQKFTQTQQKQSNNKL